MIAAHARRKAKRSLQIPLVIGIDCGHLLVVEPYGYPSWSKSRSREGDLSSYRPSGGGHGEPGYHLESSQCRVRSSSYVVLTSVTGRNGEGCLETTPVISGDFCHPLGIVLDHNIARGETRADDGYLRAYASLGRLHHELGVHGE